MVFGHVRGFTYGVTLDREYDYFEIIPELEQKFRKRFQLNVDFTQYQLTFISEFETEKRLDKTEWIKKYSNDALFKIQDDSEFQKKQKERMESYQKELPIHITDKENKFIAEVIEYLGSRCASSGWFYEDHITF